jgi:hypothetical protein
MMSYKCKVCGAEFETEKSLHAHLKAHKMYVADYYVKYYPRYNKLNGNPLPFKKKEEYFQNDFINRSQLIKWCETAPESEVKDYIIELGKRRIKRKKYAKAPFYLELLKRQLPDLDLYKKHFGTYTKACEAMGAKPIFYKGMPKEFNEDVDAEVLIDTREQQPLEFPKSKILKLDFGDYTLGGNNFSNTFVDRKSAGDFLSTFGGQVDRFKREMQRCVELDSYMYIVIEKPLATIEKEAIFTKGKRSAKLGWVLSNLISVQHEFAGHCQFVFTDNRNHSEKIIPKLLSLGDKLWNVDIQYFLDKEER